MLATLARWLIQKLSKHTPEHAVILVPKDLLRPVDECAVTKILTVAQKDLVYLRFVLELSCGILESLGHGIYARADRIKGETNQSTDPKVH